MTKPYRLMVVFSPFSIILIQFRGNPVSVCVMGYAAQPGVSAVCELMFMHQLSILTVSVSYRAV